MYINMMYAMILACNMTIPHLGSRINAPSLFKHAFPCNKKSTVDNTIYLNWMKMNCQFFDETNAFETNVSCI